MCTRVGQSPLFIAGLLTIHCLAMNGYRFGWWFERCIHSYYFSAIFARIDPTLYLRDMFTQQMKQGILNSSYFWEGIQTLLPHFELENLLFAVYVVSLYLTILSIFYLTFTLFGNRVSGWSSALLYSIGLQQWRLGAPIIYSFSVQAVLVATPLSLFAITLFMRRRRILSFLCVGLLFNVHAMFAVFLGFILTFTLLVGRERASAREALLSVVVAASAAAPSLLFVIPQLSLSAQAVSPEWFVAVKWTHWFHNNPSTWSLEEYRNFLFFLFCVCLASQGCARTKPVKDALLFVAAVGALCLIGTIFTEIIPVPLIIKLQLWRSTWIFTVLGTCFIAHFYVTSWDGSIMRRFCIIASAILLAGYTTFSSDVLPQFWRNRHWMLPLFSLLIYRPRKDSIESVYTRAASGVFCLVCILVLASFIWAPLKNTLVAIGWRNLFIYANLALFLIVFRFLEKVKVFEKNRRLAYLVASVVFVTAFDGGILMKTGGPHIDYGPFKKHDFAWVEAQKFCAHNTRKDALFVVPPYRSGFKFFSKRSTFGDWLDGQLTTWTPDSYARKWLERMSRLGWTELRNSREKYLSLTEGDILGLGKDYGVDYFVTESEAALDLPLFYQNEEYRIYVVPKP